MHVAIIMDGNGRWARRRGRPASFGHRAGVRSIKRVLDGCEQLGVKVLSVYAFSTENWTRPRAEVRALMRLFHETMQREIEEMHRRGVRIVGLPDIISRRRVPTISFTAAGQTPEAIVRHIDRFQIGIRHGDFYSRRLIASLGLQTGGVVRVSIAHYNTIAEIDRLIHHLDAVLP